MDEFKQEELEAYIDEIVEIYFLALSQEERFARIDKLVDIYKNRKLRKI